MIKEKYETLLRIDSRREEYDFLIDDFNGLINSEIKKYEKRYKSKVILVLVAGRLGLWNGNPFGGKLVHPSRVLSTFSSCDTIEIVKNTVNGELTLLGYHHDGTHNMKMYLISESRAERFGIGSYSETPENIEKWAKNIKPLKSNYLG